MIRQVAALLLILCAAAMAACSAQDDAQDELLVFAAASLTDAMAEAAAAFEAAGGAKVSVSYGPSQALAQQIASGAPADVYVAAGKPPMDFLAAGGHIAADAAVPLMSNKIVLAAAADIAHPNSIDELPSSELKRIAITEPQISPAGNYAKTALQNLALWDALQPRLLFGNDVRSILAYVQTGNADAAFVYQTDAKIAPDLALLDIVPTRAYPDVVYPAALVGNDADSADTGGDAAAFLAFLQSDAASAIFRKHGFTPLN